MSAHSVAHPVALAMPEMEPEQFEALKANIEANGQFLPILEDGEGRVIDGRHRLRACEELGIIPWRLQVDEHIGAETSDPAIIALALNRDRRHLTPGQLGEVAANVYEAARANGAPITQAKAAEAVGANTRTTERAIAARNGEARDVVVNGEVVHRASSKKKARTLEALFNQGLAQPSDIDDLLKYPLAALEYSVETQRRFADGAWQTPAEGDEGEGGEGEGGAPEGGDAPTSAIPTDVGKPEGEGAAPEQRLTPEQRLALSTERLHDVASSDREIRDLLRAGLITTTDAKSNTVKQAGPFQILRAANLIRERRRAGAVARSGEFTIAIGQGFEETGEIARAEFRAKAAKDDSLYADAAAAEQALRIAYAAWSGLVDRMGPFTAPETSSAMNRTRYAMRSFLHLAEALAAGTLEGGSREPPGA